MMRKIYLAALYAIVLLSFKRVEHDCTPNTEEIIIGTWVSDDDPNWKRVFDNLGKCTDLYTGGAPEEYYYSIIKEIINGENYETLKLINVNDNSDIYLYDINTIDNNTLVLEYLENNKLMYFTKQ